MSEPFVQATVRVADSDVFGFKPGCITFELYSDGTVRWHEARTGFGMLEKPLDALAKVNDDQS